MGESLRSGSSSEEYHDPERVARRAAIRQHEQAVDRYWAERRGARIYNEHGMRTEPHKHDALPSDPDPYRDPDDITGRRRYQASTSPLIVVTPHCSEPGCTVNGMPMPIRADRHAAIMEEGGFRCADHPRPTDRPTDHSTKTRQDEGTNGTGPARAHRDAGSQPTQPAATAGTARDGQDPTP